MNSNITNDELFKAIQLAVKDKTPLSYVRLGDGEVQLLKLPIHCQSPSDEEIHTLSLTYIFRRHNETYTKDAYETSLFLQKFKKIILDSIKGSDYLGMFTYQEIINLREMGETSVDNNYVASKVVFDYYNIDTTKLKICSPVFNRYPALGYIDNFKELIGNERITIMTDMTDELKENKKFKDTFGDSVDFISVKHNHATDTDKSFYQREYLRSQFKNIKTHVVLYGLGGGAKDLCNELKNDWGKCVIDMGSVLDAWAGHISRPTYRGFWGHCLTVPFSEVKLKPTCIL
jgi:hypothetical protein